MVCAWRYFQKKYCGISTQDKWNFKPQISSIFHFAQISDIRKAHVLGVKDFRFGEHLVFIAFFDKFNF